MRKITLEISFLPQENIINILMTISSKSLTLISGDLGPCKANFSNPTITLIK